MIIKKTNKRILLHIPSSFLDEFDREISGHYASRNEAIRRGMSLVIETKKRENTENA